MCVVIFRPAHRSFVLQQELAGRSWPASWRSIPAGLVAGGGGEERERDQAELPSTAGRIRDDGMGLEGRTEMPTRVQHTPHHPHRLPSAIAHHRRCQAVRLSGWLVEMRACPCSLVEIWIW